MVSEFHQPMEYAKDALNSFMEIKIYKNINNIGRYAAWKVASLVKEAISKQGYANIFLPAGANLRDEIGGEYQLSEDENIEEKCSICGKTLKKGDGRFRTIDGSYCLECYCKLHPRSSKKEEEST